MCHSEPCLRAPNFSTSTLQRAGLSYFPAEEVTDVCTLSMGRREQDKPIPVASCLQNILPVGRAMHGVEEGAQVWSQAVPGCKASGTWADASLL